MLKPKLQLRALPVVFVYGAILGTLWDQLHVRAGTLFYASPTVAGQPWWVPPEFGLAFVGGVLLVMLLGDPAPRRDSGRVALIEGTWLTAVYASTAFFDRWPWILFGLLALTLAARGGVLAALLTANAVPAISLVVLGPMAEAMLIAAGQFEYRTSQLGNIPAWLPLLWANGIIFMIRFTEAMLQRFGSRRIVEPANAVVTSQPIVETPQPDDV